MTLFRHLRLQRTVATLVLATFGSSIFAPLVAEAQTLKIKAQGSAANNPTPTTIVPLTGNGNSGSGNSVLLPVGPRGLPGAAGTGSSGGNVSADPAAAFAAALSSLHELAEQSTIKHPGKSATSASLLAAVNALRTQYHVVQQQQQQANAAFAATQAFLTQQGLPSVIQQRHQAMVTAFNSRMGQLKQVMASLDAVAAGQGDAQSALTQLQQFLAQYPSESDQGANSTAPTWGHSVKNATAQKALAREAKAPAAGVAGTLSGINLPASTLTDTVVPGDTAATDDAQSGNAAIAALAKSLNNNPVAIYEYVRNKIQYQVGYGSLQGAAATLQSQAGNDIDSASLLIALYRAAGIPSRYAYGTIQVPIARVQNWLQVDNANAAIALLNQAGIPNNAVSTGGSINAVQLEHVWVQALVDASPSGGAVNRNPGTWLALDPSFKQDQAQAGLSISNSVSVNANGIFDSAASGAACTTSSAAGLNQANVQGGFSNFQGQLSQLINAQGSDLTVGGLLGSEAISPENFSILPNSLPYQTVAQTTAFDSIPTSLQGQLHIQLYANSSAQSQGTPAVSYSASYADIAGHRLTLAFAPATSADAATLAAYMPKAHSDGSPIQASEFPATIPGYLINVTANILLDGQVVASSSTNNSAGFVLGSELIGDVGLFNPAAAPSGAWNDNTFEVHAGDYHAIVADPQGINAAQVSAVQTRLAATVAQLGSKSNSLTTDAVTGDLLYQSALSYFATVDANAGVFQRASGVIEQRLPSTGRAVAVVQPHLSLGIVQSVSFPGVILDIDHLQSAVASQSAGLNAVAYTRQSNQRNAAYAHLLLEQHYGTSTAPSGATQAVSAMRLLANAASQSSPQDPVYAVTSANLAQVLPGISLTAAQSTDVQNAAGAGLTVLVAQNAATIGNWLGQGMEEDDPVTGAGIYRISGSSASSNDANVAATAAIYPQKGMPWLALAQPNQAAASITPAMSTVAAIDNGIVGTLAGASANSSSQGVRWSAYPGQAEVTNGLFLANLAGAESNPPTPCQAATGILAANLGTTTATGSGSGSGGGSGGVPDIPVITSSPVTAGTAGQAYQYPVAASDPQGKSLTYSLPAAPSGMTIGSTGVISWANPVQGIVSVTVRADNGQAYAQQSYQLSIGTAPLPVSVAIGVSPGVIQQGQSTVVTVAGNGGSGNLALSLTADGKAVTLTSVTGAANTATATITGSVIGAHKLVATATSGTGTNASSASQTSLYAVADPADTGSPVAAITSPTLDATLTAPTPVIGTATDADLAYYQLLLAPSNGSNNPSWSEIARGYSNVANGTLGTLDPTQLPNGIYQLALVVVNVNGVQTSTLITVEINSHMKIGQFSLSFQDVNVNASGIPIQVTRTYDTRKRGQSLDFGYGWSVDYQNLQVNKNIQIGLSWTVVSNVSQLQTCIQPGQAHNVDIILPTGELARFTANNSPQCSLVYVPNVNIQFTPLPGTTSSLALENIPDGLEFQGGIILDQTGDSGTNAWNPQFYALTTADNFVYHITDGVGITSVTDPNGNTLTYGQNGIVHSNGTGVAFQRDANNRITQITDPMGRTINYTYSANGDLTSVNDRNNATSTMAYDGNHGLASYTDPDGNLTARYVYDATGKLIAAYDAKGNAITMAHNANQDVVTDQRGNKTTYAFDSAGNITQITNALGQTTTYTYDASGNQTSVTDSAGNTTKMTVDPQSFLLTSQTDPLGHTTSTVYDSTLHVNPTTTTDANGNQTAYTYFGAGSSTITQPLGRVSTITADSSGNTSQLNIAGQVTAFNYDAKGNATSVTDAAGNIINYTFDANGNTLSQSWQANGKTLTSSQIFDGNGHVVSQTDALGNTIKTTYTAGGQVASNTDAQGRVTGYQYDPATGKLALTTYPDGTTKSNSYDATGNLVASTDRQGRITQYQYDAINRLTATTLPDGTGTAIAYNSAGWTSTTTDARGKVTVRNYDAAGRVTSSVDPLGKQTQFAYDANGNRTSVTDALGNVTQYQYDALNRLISTTYPDGKTTAIAWRTDSRKQSDTDQNGNVTTYGYDPVGRLNQVVQTNATTQQQTAYAYDGSGNKTAQTDANGNTTSWSYDANSRVAGRTFPAGQKDSYQYDVNGNIAAYTDFRGNTTSYSYNTDNNVIQEQRPDGTTIVTAYTPSGRIASIAVSNGNANSIASVQSGKTSYTYDAQDRLTKQTNPDGSFIAYNYDANGNVTQRSTAKGTIAYAYDANNHLIAVTDLNGKTTNYTWDANGRKSTMLLPNGVTTSYVYDSVNRLAAIVNQTKVGSVVSGEAYNFSASGQRTQVLEYDTLSTSTNGQLANPSRTASYTYDSLNRLVQENVADRVGNSTTIGYQYDKVGNRVQKTIANSGGTETITYTYDSNDRLSTETDSIGTTQTQTAYSWDASGNLQTKTSPSQYTVYKWDSQNRLIEVDQGANQTSATAIANYVYDAAGKRVQKIESNGVKTSFLIDGNMPYAQVLEEDSTQNGSATSTYYTWGDSNLISLASASQQSYVHANSQGTTNALTDASGSVTDTYVFDSYGNLQSRTGLTSNPYQYTGEYFDSEIQEQYNRARWYDAGTGRFISVDAFPAKPALPISANKYVYAYDDPVDDRDPSGNVTLAELEETETIVGDMRTVATENFQKGLAREGGQLMQEMGQYAESEVKKIIEGCLKPTNIKLGKIKGSKRTIDFLVEADEQVLRIEAKSRIPTKWGPALRRLKDQLLANKEAEGGLVTVIGAESEDSLGVAVEYLTNAGLKEGIDFNLIQGLVEGARWLGELAGEACFGE